MSDATVLPLIHGVTRVVELIGIALILVGAAYSGVRYVQQAVGGAREAAYRALRSNLGRSILLGLELLVAADIINTVAIEPTLDSLAVLAGIVAIRTFLSFSLELEIEGRWPWQREPKV
jgi:uncharacterized membrane protein